MRVLVADDHALFRDGIISLLETAGFEIAGQASDGEEAMRLALELKPDLVLMDFHMPKMTGIEALKAIKSEAPNIKVVMLTVSEDDEVIVEAAKAGVDGYLFKHLHGDEFLESLKGLERGEAAITLNVAARLMQGLSHENSSTSGSDVESNLTDREMEVLSMVAKGLPNKEIGGLLGVSENTVKYHVRGIMQKLNAQNRTEAVTQALQKGWITSE